MLFFFSTWVLRSKLKSDTLYDCQIPTEGHQHYQESVLNVYEYTIAELSILEERQLDEDNGSGGAPLLFTSVLFE